MEVLICRGKVFHNLGTVTTNAWSSLCFNLDLGTTRNIWSADFKDLAGVYQVSRSELHFNKCNPTFTFYRLFTFIFCLLTSRKQMPESLIFDLHIHIQISVPTDKSNNNPTVGGGMRDFT